MRLGTARPSGGGAPVAVAADGASPERLEPLADPLGLGLLGLIEAGPDALEAAIAGRTAAAAERLELVAPLRPPKIVAIGLNYLDHIRESNAPRPEVPLVFTKFPTSVIGPGEPIPIDATLTERVDWEVELAAVDRHADAPGGRRGCARRACSATRSPTTSRPATCSSPTGSGCAAKSLDGFCPLGPVVVTADEIGDPQAPRPRDRRQRRDDAGLEHRGDALRRRRADRVLLAELHARARRRDPDRDAVGLRRVHGSAALAAARATWSRSRSRGSGR